MSGSLARWVERRMVPVRFPLDTWDCHAAKVLAHIASDPVPSILGEGWRALRIGRQTVHWCVPAAYWQIHTPAGIVAGQGIADLWMLVHDCDRVQAVCDMSIVVAGE